MKNNGKLPSAKTFINEKKMNEKDNEIGEIKGKDITDISIAYENITLKVGDQTYFIKPEDLLSVVKKGNFKTEKKRTRIWATPK